MSVDCGVPQGSVLGPILFILNIDKICNLNIYGQIVTYADNTCLLFSADSWYYVYTKAETGLKKVINHLNQRKLSLNYKKTNFMNFTINYFEYNFNELPMHFCDDCSLCKNECKILFRVPSIRYLGLGDIRFYYEMESLYKQPS